MKCSQASYRWEVCFCVNRLLDVIYVRFLRLSTTWLSTALSLPLFLSNNEILVLLIPCDLELF